MRYALSVLFYGDGGESTGVRDITLISTLFHKDRKPMS